MCVEFLCVLVCECLRGGPFFVFVNLFFVDMNIHKNKECEVDHIFTKTKNICIHMLRPK